MTVYSSTDTGCVRASNQDAVLSGQFEGGCWGVVCDGMGGANGGDIASATAVEIIGKLLSEGLTSRSTGDEVRSLVEQAVNEANTAIYSRACSEPVLFGMGTTVVCAVVIERNLYVAHAGDSRAYLIRRGRIKPVTKDHSMVQELVDIGRLTEKQARTHPRRNIITRALGVGPEIAVDHSEHVFEKDTTVLLCSDGLSGCVEDKELLDMAGSISPEELCGAYIDKAKERGGPDNITALVIAE